MKASESVDFDEEGQIAIAWETRAVDNTRAELVHFGTWASPDCRMLQQMDEGHLGKTSTFLRPLEFDQM